MTLVLLHPNGISLTFHYRFPVIGAEKGSEDVGEGIWRFRQTVEDNVPSVSESDLLEDDGTFGDDQNWFDALFVEVTRTLARLLLRVLTNETDLCIFVFDVGSQLDKVEVLWHEQDGVAGTAIVDIVPDLLSEVTEPGGIGMFKAGHIWEAAKSHLDALIF